MTVGNVKKTQPSFLGCWGSAHLWDEGETGKDMGLLGAGGGLFLAAGYTDVLDFVKTNDPTVLTCAPLYVTLRFISLPLKKGSLKNDSGLG